MRVHGLLLLGFLAFSGFGREKATDALSLPELQRAIGAHITQVKFAEATWGIKVVSLDSGAVLFETNAQKLLKPASNAKVFIGALALDALGAEYRIRTSLLAANPPTEQGVLKGNLIVYGRGDPSISARFQDGNYANILGRLVATVRSAGIKRIEGDLVGDETFFSGPRFGSGWTWDDLQYYYGAEVSALSVQDNVVDLHIRPGAKMGDPCLLSIKPETGYLEFVNRTRTTDTNIPVSISVVRPLGERRVYLTGTLPRNFGTHVDAVTVPNPALWFVTLLREALEKQGIVIAGKTSVRSWPDHPPTDLGALKEIAFIESAPMSEIVPMMLKPSQNLYAQLLLLQVGVRSRPSGSTEDAGIRELLSFLKRVGINPNEVLLEEGSGLSRSCLLTPNSLVTLLQAMAKHPLGHLFRESLPAPGEGTLRTRFRDWRDDPTRKTSLRVKTGTIRYVNTLSGYLRTRAGEQLAFSVLLNAYDNTGSPSSRDDVETVVRLIEKAAPEGR